MAKGWRERTGVIVMTLALSGTAVSMQQTMLVPLLPEFPRLLDSTVEGASWLITATLLTGSVSVPTVSRLADMFGKKRMMLVVLSIMVLGSVVGSLSSTLAPLILARALQGVGMALVPVGIAVMRDELPREKVAFGVGLMSATLAIGAGAGLPLSGFIADRVDWHGIFWVTGGIGLLMLLVAGVVLRESPVRGGGSFDYPGAILISLALTAVLLAFSKGGDWGWSSVRTWSLLLMGLAALTIWVPMELRVRYPIVDVRVATRPGVLLVNLAAVLTGFATFGNMIVTTQLLQSPGSTDYGQGLDVLHAGLWMMPSTLAFGAMAPVSAVVTRRLGPQTTLFIGAMVMAAAYVARAYLSSELWQVVGGSVLVSIGTAMTFAAMPVLLMRAVPITQTASANGLNTLLRSTGSSLSSATLAAVSAIGVVRVGNDVFPSFTALIVMFWIAAGSSFLAAILSLPTFRMSTFAEEAELPHHERTGNQRDERPLPAEATLARIVR